MIEEGKSVALVSDAGMPLISDPGYKLVEECIAAGVHMTCLPGATASLTALALSGLPTDRFMFAGFLPPKSAARKSALQELKNIPATLVFYETAPRLLESLEDMQAVLGDRRAAVARELTKKFEEVKRENLSGLIAYYRDAGAPRGEIVIVIDAAGDEAGGWSEADVERLLRQKLFQENMSVKDASALVAAETGLKKKDIYQRALLLNKRK
jgi:16S rRNA (cytidine1402-2'-O)-methyltransferase